MSNIGRFCGAYARERRAGKTSSKCIFYVNSSALRPELCVCWLCFFYFARGAHRHTEFNSQLSRQTPLASACMWMGVTDTRTNLLLMISMSQRIMCERGWKCLIHFAPPPSAHVCLHLTNSIVLINHKYGKFHTVNTFFSRKLLLLRQENRSWICISLTRPVARELTIKFFGRALYWLYAVHHKFSYSVPELRWANQTNINSSHAGGRVEKSIKHFFLLPLKAGKKCFNSEIIEKKTCDSHLFAEGVACSCMHAGDGSMHRASPLRSLHTFHARLVVSFH